ncbi:MAG: FtsB family cell division protein [Inquilinaceae bacterium]
MSASQLFRRKLRLAIWPIFCVCLFVYFAYHATQGDHGVLARQQLRLDIAAAEAALAEVQARRLAIEHRVDLLMPPRVDADLVEERARLVLGYAHPDELVILGDTDR